MAATNFTVKNPNCLKVTITPIGTTVGQIIGQQAITSTFGGTRLLSSQVVLQGVFSEDGDPVRLESTSEGDDEYIEGADGSICVRARPQRNKRLILNINSCNDAVLQLIQLKQRALEPRVGGIRYFQVVVTDFCTGRTITSEAAWMIGNPGESLGGFSDDGEEVVFILSNIKDNQGGFTNSPSIFNGTTLT